MTVKEVNKTKILNDFIRDKSANKNVSIIEYDQPSVWKDVLPYF